MASLHSFLDQRLHGATARYGMALVLLAGTLLARWALWPALGSSSPYLTSYLAVAATALWCGLGPAVMVTLLSAIIGNLAILRPFGPLNYSAAELARLAWMLASNLAIALLADRTRRAHLHAHQQAEMSHCTERALRESE